MERMDNRLEYARTLPSSYYRSEENFEILRDAAFARSWHFVSDISQVRVPGQIYPFELLENYLPEPLMLVRDNDDTLRCLSNVCTHRGTVLVDAACHLKTVRCRYHGRRFGLDGKFQSMPECEGMKDFPSESDNLPQVPLASLGNLLFASLNPFASFEEIVKPITDRLYWFPWNELKFDASRSREYLVQAHWGLYCENYLEGFHIPYVHAGLAEQLSYKDYQTEVYEYANLQLGVAKGADSCFDIPEGAPDYGTAVAGYYYWIFPNLMLNFYPWGLSINVVKPVTPQRTRVSFLCYVAREDLIGEGAGAELDRVEREDEEIVEAVQRGMKSRLYHRGRFSPKREECVHHFQCLIDRFLNESNS